MLAVCRQLGTARLSSWSLMPLSQYWQLGRPQPVSSHEPHSVAFSAGERLPESNSAPVRPLLRICASRTPSHLVVRAPIQNCGVTAPPVYTPLPCGACPALCVLILTAKPRVLPAAPAFPRNQNEPNRQLNKSKPAR